MEIRQTKHNPDLENEKKREFLQWVLNQNLTLPLFFKYNGETNPLKTRKLREKKIHILKADSETVKETQFRNLALNEPSTSGSSMKATKNKMYNLKKKKKKTKVMKKWVLEILEFSK